MKLYDINQEILDCIDMETGEIIAPEKLEALQMDKHEKLRNIAFVALNAVPDEFLAPQPPKVDKVGLKKAVKGGAVIDGVTIVEKQNIQIR